MPIENGPAVRLMDATDEQFQAFVVAAGIPVDDNGIVEWSFDDRCRVINHACKYGSGLPFVEKDEQKINSEVEQKPFTNNSSPELIEPHRAAQEATTAPLVTA